MQHKIITIGEVLMRLSAPGHERIQQTNSLTVHYGGCEANVGISLSHFGEGSTHLCTLPDNDIGKAVISYLRSHNVCTKHIPFMNKGRMGLYFLENGAMQRSSKIIYDRFNSSFSMIDPDAFDWDSIFDNANWLHWSGITPAISKNAALFCKTAIQKAKEKGITISADINYRRNLWQYGKIPLDIMPELIQDSSIIVGDTTDFENCMGISAGTFEEGCEKIATRFPNIKTIATTRRTTFSASHNSLYGLLWDDGVKYTSTTHEMTSIVDRIGGGDSFMAGLIYGLLHFDLEKALEFGIAASVLKHSIPGDANNVTVNEVLQLTEGTNIGKLLR